MKKLLFLLIGLQLNAFSQATDTIALRFSKKIGTTDLKKHLSILASDEYEGRETGQKGQKMAAEYIKNQFIQLNIPPLKQLDGGYFQSFEVDVYQPQRINIRVDESAFSSPNDYYSFSSILKDTNLLFDEFVFAGYGINTSNYNDYDQITVKNKAVLILKGEPYEKSGKSFITGETKASDWTTNFRRKNNEAFNQGIKTLFIVDDSLAESYKKNEHRIQSTRMDLSGLGARPSIQAPLVIYISTAMANKMLAPSKKDVTKLKKEISKRGKSKPAFIKRNVSLDVKQEINKLSSENVLGYIEGSDLKDEVIVITAHYDHLGIQNGVVFNGADDDGSGTVAVMELAKAFAEAKNSGHGPRRSILFMTVAGEEKGLLGSEYYTAHPVFNLEKTVCNLNIDMIGRLDEAHKNDANYIYLIGSDKLSKELHNLSEQTNKLYTNINLDYTYNDENDPNRYYYRSDHYNFAKNKVPVIFYFNGVHADYHQETDEVEKIDFSKMEKITHLVFFTAWEIANRTNRISLDKK